MTDRAAGKDRSGLAIWLLAMTPFVVLAVRHIGWTPAAEAGDYAQYLSHARALVTGHAYGDIGYIRDPETWPVGPAAYPPGLPLTLAPLVASGGIHTPLLRLFMLASLGAFSWFAFRRLTMDVEAWQAAIGVGFAAFALETAGATLAPISDPGFCALLWATILVVDRSERWSWGQAAAVTALGGAAMLYRLAGVALVPALAVYGVLARQRHGPRVFVPVLAWTTVGVAASGFHLVPSPFGPDFMERVVTHVRDLPKLTGLLARVYRSALFAAELYPLPAIRANAAWHVAASLLTLVGLVALARRWRRSFLAPLMLASAAMLVIVPVIDGRYLWPFYPVIAAALALGTSLVVRRIAVQWGVGESTRVARVLAACLLSLVVSSALVRAVTARRVASVLAGDDAKALYAWLRERANREPVRAIFSNPRVLTLESQVPAMAVLPRAPAGQLVAIADHAITHVVWQRPDASTCFQRIIDALPDRYPDRFALEYSNPTFRVYRVLSSGTPPGAYEVFSWPDADAFCTAHLDR